MPIASALTGTHRDCLIVASFGHESEIQPLMSQGQIVSADHDLMDTHATIIIIMIVSHARV